MEVVGSARVGSRRDCSVAVPLGQAKTVWDGMYSEAQAARGKAAYEAQCAFCHQSDLRGQGFAPG